jgi:hypothetical protein
MLKYSTKRIEYLFKGEDTWLKTILKKYFFKQNPYGRSEYRAPKIKFKRTRSEQEEWDKCKNDIIYFAENYYYCFSGKTFTFGLIKLRDYQKAILKSYVDNRTIVCSARQMGNTTLNKIYALWSILFKVQYVQIITDTLAAHFNLMDSLRQSYVYLPYYMQKGIINFNKHEIVCDDYSRITDNRINLHGKKNVDKYFTVIADNAAFLFKADLLDLSKKLNYNCKLIITSTPNGNNAFYKIWLNALDKNSFHLNPIKLIWSDNKERDDLWAREMIRNIGQDSFDEECNLIFRNKSK